MKDNIQANEDNGQLLDDELILTNSVEEGPTEEAGSAGNGNVQASQPEQSFREALHEQIHEEDVTPRGQKMSILKILGGDFFTAQILRRNVLLMMLVSLFIVVYISNRYRCEKSMLEIDRLKKELQDSKYKALSTSSRLTEQSRQSNVLDMLKNNRDSVLRIADRPPFIVNVPE